MARSGHRWGTLALVLAAAVFALVASLSGVINTYYPGAATAAAASTTIRLGAATGAATPIAIGDLVLVIPATGSTCPTKSAVS